jgi:hypothetical protein
MDEDQQVKHEEFENIKRKLLDAISEVLAGTEFAPPEGVITEAVVCCLWMEPNGTMGPSIFPATNHLWSTYGILKDAVIHHENIMRYGEPEEGE